VPFGFSFVIAGGLIFQRFNCWMIKGYPPGILPGLILRWQAGIVKSILVNRLLGCRPVVSWS
jgi:hypothetical protein